MDSALIVSNSEKSVRFLADFLTEAAVSDITTVSSSTEARRILIDNDYDLCIVNAPLPDEFGESLACHIAEKNVSEVMLIVKNDIFDEISEKTEDFGVITIAKPISRVLFWNALKMAQVTHKKLRAMQSENKKLIKRIEDIRIVDRAKCVLIAAEDMSEPEAHRYIEKQAMDLRLTRREVAEEILNKYENYQCV